MKRTITFTFPHSERAEAAELLGRCLRALPDARLFGAYSDAAEPNVLNVRVDSPLPMSEIMTALDVAAEDADEICPVISIR